MPKKRSVLLILLFLCILSSAVILSRFTARNENQKFEDYTSELFRQEVASNSISLHYTLKNPGDYGIQDIPETFGLVNTDADAACASAENALALLHNYDRRQLSDDNRLTYDILESYITSSLEEAKYILYEEPLAPLTGTQSQLPVLLSEYQFYNKEDCESYLRLLAQIPDYFHSIAEFERAKSKEGLFMPSYSADDIIAECQAFVEMGDNNYLYSSFEERLEELDLSKGEKDAYREINSENIKDYVFPAYQELISVLTELRDTGKNSGGLCHFPDGDKYYELTIASQTGSSRSIPELQELALSQMAEDAAALQEVLAPVSDASSFSDLFSAEADSIAPSQPDDILAALKSDLSGLFPNPPKVNTQIKYVQESMEEYLSPAFYMIPAIDDTKNNVIYINQGHIPDGLTLFTTLAHEGYPGHLYQTVYYSATNPDPIRSLLNFGGYTEGWATYSEMLSYYFAPVSKEYASMMQHNSSLILGLYALADMGIHYDGWSLLDTVSFFRGYGITDTDTIEEIYNLIIGDPGNYLKYYIGYVEFLELKKEAMTTWGDDFTQEKFHKEVLETGPAPFDILQKQLLK